MAKQLVPDTAQFRMQFVGPAGANPEFELYVRDTVVPWTAGALNAMAAGLAAWVAAELDTYYGADLVFSRIEAEDLGADPGVQTVNTYSTAGAASGQLIPMFATGLVQLNGTGGALPRRGFLNHPGLTEAQCDGDYIDSTVRTNILGVYDNLPAIIAAVSATSAMVIVSRFNKALYGSPTNPKGKRPEGITNTVSTFQMRRLLGSRRSRRATTQI